MYIIKNLKQFVKDNTLMFFLFIISLFFSVLIMLFAYGIYAEYNEQYKSELDGTGSGLGILDSKGNKLSEDDYEYCMFFQNLPGYYDCPTQYKQVKPFVYELCDIFKDKLEYTELNFSVKPIPPGTGSVDDLMLSINVKYENGKLKLNDLGDYLESGRDFTDKEMESDEKVCVASYAAVEKDPNGFAELSQDADGTYYVTVCNNKYKVVGKTLDRVRAVFFTPEGAPGDMYINDFYCMKLKSPPTRDEYNAYKELVKKYFKDIMEDVPEMPLINIEKTYFYKTNIWLAILIAVAAALNLAALYKNVLMSRRKTFAVFRLEGASKLRICGICLAETGGLAVALFVVAAAVFKWIVMPLIKDYYPYAAEAYGISIYLAMFFVFLAITLAVLSVMIWRYLSKTPLQLIKGGDVK